MIVVDASVLIVLAKIHRLGILRRLYGKAVIGPVVLDEVVVRGKAVSAAGVEQVEKAIEDGWIEVVKISLKEKDLMQKIQQKSRLDRGEIESLALADARGLRLIVDDKEARAHAEAMEMLYMGTAAVLFEAFMHRHLSLSDLENAVADLSQVLWLSPAVVTEILKRAREVQI